MCGICGVVDFSAKGIETESLLSLRESMSHRGPDDAGMLIHGNAGIAHRRLSIIDLSEAGRQPLRNEDGSVWVVCNGEIYNYRELRVTLAQMGHVFRSNSDTEVLVHGFEEWGIERLLASLKGMFAFAIWDSRAEQLWLVRDRLGVKPAYFIQTGTRFSFASEPHGLYALHGNDNATADPESLDSYLAFGYVPPGYSLFHGVTKVLPAHAVRFDRDGLHSTQYWDVPHAVSRGKQTGAVLDEVESRLGVAVERRLESDVPLGIFLSGGIDSGLVTALAATRTKATIRTFTVGFAGSSGMTDERPYARAVADRYRTDHHELIVEAAHVSILPRLIWQAGEPFADVSLLPTYQMCAAARSEITVALSGDGGDESFCGYLNVYAAFLSRVLAKKIPLPVRKLMMRSLRYGDASHRGFALTSRLATLLWYADRDVAGMYDLPNWWHSRLRSRVYSRDWERSRTADARRGSPSVVVDLLTRASDLDEVERVLYVDLHLRLPGDYLTKVDIASNAVALEVRSPFLDQDLVEYAFAIPPGTRMQGLRQKGLLRELAKRHLPPEVVRQRKLGFAPPLANWLKGEWAPLIDEYVLDGIAKRGDVFSGPVVVSAVSEFRNGYVDHSQRLWALICLEIWWRLFVDRTMASSDEVDLRQRTSVRDR